MHQTLQYREDEAVATIRLHRPEKKNSLNAEMRHEMASLLKELARKPAIRAVVITGGDDIFCAGADISEMGGPADAESSYHHAREFQILFDQVEALPQPVIVAVSGFAPGGCGELAIAADFRIASETARFGLPEIKIGAFPGGGGTQLQRLIGVAKAKEMILTGDPIGAQEALAAGLVMKVVPAGKCLEEASSLAGKLAALPRLALQASKMLINRSQELDLATGLEFEARTFAAIAHTHDLAEGTRAFLEKRKANFTGN
ncbi:MAG TPA: enoyl-CoA hydratase-related protein [Candidatus Polarisedimenticolaceae bacterium]|nr:enoyl-CoA hydratase-related protein [Candidatus Polarisedimenticolaceae bacterium]